MVLRDIPKNSDRAGGVVKWLRTWTLDFDCLGPSLGSAIY